MKMNINFQVTGNDRKKVATYTILFPQFQKHKISDTDYDELVLSSKQFKKSEKRTTKTNGTAVLKKKFWSVT